MMAVDLHPRGSFHVGELGVGREETLPYVPSDTLYAALVYAWTVTGEPGPFVPPPLRITSAFPRVGSLRLYPRPFVRIRTGREQRDQLGKKLLRFAWCSERIFGQLLQAADMTPLAHPENFIGDVWFHPDDRALIPSPPVGAREWAHFWAVYPPTPHVAIDRVKNAPNLFHSGRLTFGPECGLWFGVEWSAPDARARLERALNYLADAGLGGLRSTGHGAFSFALREAAIPAPPNPSGYAVTLSRYLPASVEEVAAALQAPGVAYKLVWVGGWCQDDTGRAWRRKQVRMVSEGSVLRWDGHPLGQVADLRPEGVGTFGDRPVLRYGLAFPVPVAQEALL
jgi:CRISPR-associated protein Csm4